MECSYTISPAGKPITHETYWILRVRSTKIISSSASILKPRNIVFGLEPENAESLKKIFPHIIFIEYVELFNDAVSPYRGIVSRRFHGVILGLRLQRPVFSIRVPKGAALLHMLGLGEFAYARAQDLMFLKTHSSHSFAPQHRFFKELFENYLHDMFVTLKIIPASQQLNGYKISWIEHYVLMGAVRSPAGSAEAGVGLVLNSGERSG